MAWIKKALAAAVVALPLALAGGTGTASTPPTSSVTVPTTAGQTVTTTWTGTVPPGVDPTSDCTTGLSVSDEHDVTVNVPAGVYDALKATFTFNITWTPNPPFDPGGGGSDLILTVVGPDGNVVGSSDGGSATETVVAENLPGGTYTVLACGFSNVAPQDYNGKLEIRTEALEASLPSAPAHGLEFSAAVAADNQRDEAEPLVEIDRAGNIYGCGPTGFSQLSDYAQVSTDGGDQYHLLGIPPRGQAEAGGGGDCTIALGLAPNSRGTFDWAMSGLGPLTGFATAISPNNGRSIATSGGDLVGGTTDEGLLADRQWQTFVDEDTVLLIYNVQVPRNTVVIRSDDRGLTFNPANAVIAARSPLFPGPINYDDAHNVVYFGWDDTGTLAGKSGDFVNLSISKDRGQTWFSCRVDFVDGEVPGFVMTNHDSAGNIYVAYGDSGAFHTYMKALPRENVDKCNKPVAQTSAIAPNLTDPGFGPRIQVDRDAVRTTVFPWVTAGGAPGRVAVTFYGTESNGDPNLGTFDASWDVYVNLSLNALSTDPANPPTFSQVKATTHPLHYDSICLQGLGCDLSVPPGDRTMADFYAIDHNPVTDRLIVLFNRTNKKPDEDLGHVASPMSTTQIGGPTLGGSSLTPTRPAIRKSSVDPTADALSSYSITVPGVVPPDPLSANEPAADFVSVSVGPELDLHDDTQINDGGFTVTMKVADLTTESLLQTLARTQSQSLLWVFRFTNGHQDVAASARFNAAQGFTFGYNEYTTGATPCESGATEGDKCILYPGDTPIQGDVNQSSGTIRLSVPRFLLRALSGPTGPGQRPTEVPATVGSRFYDATAWSLGNNVSPVQNVQSFLYPLDNTPAMDFLLPAGGGRGAAGCKITGGGAIAGKSGGEAKFSLDVHGDLRGKVDYRDAGANVDFRSTEIASVNCSNGTVTGTGFNGDDEVRFTVDVGDNSESGAGGDVFGITLTTPSSSPVYSNSGTLRKGNIQVHS